MALTNVRKATQDGARQMMIDTATKKTLQVLTDGTIFPYIVFPATRLDEVCQILDRHGFRYDVEEDFISFDDRPAEAMINFRRGTDPAAVQAALDNCR